MSRGRLTPLKPCADCGGPKPRGRGRMWCDETIYGPFLSQKAAEAFSLATPSSYYQRITPPASPVVSPEQQEGQ